MEREHKRSKKSGPNLQDWTAVRKGHETLPFLSINICEQCDYHSYSIGEHLGRTSKYYYCNLHGVGKGSICEVTLKTNLLKYDVSYWTHCDARSDLSGDKRKLPFTDCPFILEHTVANKKEDL